MNTPANRKNLGDLAWMTVGLVMMGVVAWLDYVTGAEIGLSLFYLPAIAVVTWFANAALGVAIAVLAAEVWMAVDIVSGTLYSSDLIHVWNASIRLSFFLVVVYLLNDRKALEEDRIYSRTDYLTGAMSSRFFHALAQREIERLARHPLPFTAAFLDIDNFKAINDTFGHKVGDKVLCVAAATMRDSLRKTDLIARIGGDEFAILMPDVDFANAPQLISKLHRTLNDAALNNGWAVTFSIGVVSFTAAPVSVDEVIRIADRVMYTVKNSGKNGVGYSEYVKEVGDAQLSVSRL
jgi:diguanylate cyclase (GGDEF)-like protein